MASDVTTPSKTVLRDAIRALEAMEKASGRLQKEEILADNKDNPYLTDLLKYALDGTVYHVTVNSAIELTGERIPPVKSFSEFVNLLSKLSSRTVTGNAATEEVLAFLGSVHPRLRKWYMRALHHDLRIGVGKKTIDKVFGRDFLANVEEGASWYYHGCLLAKSYDDVIVKKGKSLEYPVGVEVKLDGERALLFVFPETDEVQVWTRGKKRRNKVENVAPFRSWLIEYAREINKRCNVDPNTPLFLDGEFFADNWNQTSSIVRRTKNFSEQDFLEKVRTIVWDWAPIDDYMKREFSLIWKRRKAILMKAAGLKRPSKRITQAYGNIYVMGHRIAYTREELYDIYNRAVDAGFEGLMVKEITAPHVFSRNHTYVLKLKPEDSMTGEVVEVYPGKNKHAEAPPQDRKRVYKALSAYDAVNLSRDGSYYHLAVDSMAEAERIADELRDLVSDAADRRISTHLENTVSYRYGCRLGYLVVECEGKKFHVGGGFRHKAGQDERMEFWRDRDNLVGMKIDFVAQADPAEVAAARFNRFVRIREDL